MKPSSLVTTAQPTTPFLSKPVVGLTALGVALGALAFYRKSLVAAGGSLGSLAAAGWMLKQRPSEETKTKSEDPPVETPKEEPKTTTVQQPTSKTENTREKHQTFQPLGLKEIKGKFTDLGLTFFPTDESYLSLKTCENQLIKLVEEKREALTTKLTLADETEENDRETKALELWAEQETLDKADTYVKHAFLLGELLLARLGEQYEAACSDPKDTKNTMAGYRADTDHDYKSAERAIGHQIGFQSNGECTRLFQAMGAWNFVQNQNFYCTEIDPFDDYKATLKCHKGNTGATPEVFYKESSQQYQWRAGYNALAKRFAPLVITRADHEPETRIQYPLDLPKG